MIRKNLPIIEAHLGVDSLGWNSILVKHFVELDSVVDMTHKDDNLVELELIDQVHQFGDLVALLKAHIVLAKTVKGQLALVLDEHLSWVAHELAASDLNLVGESSSEHHHLLAVRGLLEDLLDVATHI